MKMINEFTFSHVGYLIMYGFKCPKYQVTLTFLIYTNLICHYIQHSSQ